MSEAPNLTIQEDRRRSNGGNTLRLLRREPMVIASISFIVSGPDSTRGRNRIAFC